MKLLSAVTSLLAGTIATGLIVQTLEPLPYTPWSMAALASIITLATISLFSRVPASASPTHKDKYASGPRQQGTVKWFNATKGFGFIVCDSGEEVFVHFRALRNGGRRSLKDGLSVSFVITSGDRGPQASDVEIM